MRPARRMRSWHERVRGKGSSASTSGERKSPRSGFRASHVHPHRHRSVRFASSAIDGRSMKTCKRMRARQRRGCTTNPAGRAAAAAALAAADSTDATGAAVDADSVRAVTESRVWACILLLLVWGQLRDVFHKKSPHTRVTCTFRECSERWKSRAFAASRT